jgi:hypothetical protein
MIMRMLTKTKKAAKTFLNLAVSNFCPSLAPIGAVSTDVTIMPNVAGK